jgi:hypothetical protein
VHGFSPAKAVGLAGAAMSGIGREGTDCSRTDDTAKRTLASTRDFGSWRPNSPSSGEFGDDVGDGLADADRPQPHYTSRITGAGSAPKDQEPMLIAAMASRLGASEPIALC